MSSDECIDNAVSMVEVLEEEEQLEKDATAVLGDGDLHNCTYDMGYLDRQALYACMTCTKNEDTEATSPAGVCLACSYDCHEDHQLIELYTKRFFKCDCGNSKFGENKCKLRPNKMAENSDNVYNQNFGGVYCTCSRPYPDPDDKIEDEMIQCIICEDWLHGRHLGSDLPETEFEEMICVSCMNAHQFLWAYTVKSALVVKLINENQTVNVTDNSETDKDDKDKQPTENAGQTIVKHAEDTSTDKETAIQNESSKALQDLSNTTDGDNAGGSKDLNVCMLKDLLSSSGGVVKPGNGAQFWTAGWRNKLCTCQSCKDLYDKEKVSYLVDVNDTISSYESRGKAKHSSSNYEKGLTALSGMNRTKQVEAIHGFNSMKAELSEYLKKFAENGKVVRQEDIQEFFKDMTNKRQKVGEGSAFQHSCR